MKTIVLVLMFGFLMMGCGGKGYPVEEERVQNFLIEKPGDSKLTFYRIVGHYRTGCTVKLSIDEQVVVEKMMQAENVTVYLPSGHHTFKAILCERFETTLNVVVDNQNTYNYAISVDPPDGFIIYDLGEGFDKE